MFSVRCGRTTGEDLHALNEELAGLARKGAFKTAVALIVGSPDALVTSVMVLQLALTFWVVLVNNPWGGNIVVASRSDIFRVGDDIEIIGPLGPS